MGDFRRSREVLVLCLVIACGGRVTGDTTLGFVVQAPEDLGVSHLSQEQVEAIDDGSADPPAFVRY